MSALTPETDEQAEKIEWVRGRLDSAYGTDGNHWVAARLLVMSGVLDELCADVRAEALAPLVDATDFQRSALSAVLAADVWDQHKGRTCDYADLGPVTQDVQRRTAGRYLDALARFLTR